MNDQLDKQQSSGSEPGTFNANFSFQFGNFIKRGAQLVNRQFLILLGVLIVFGILSAIAAALLMWIPVVGNIGITIITAALFAGFYLGFHKIDRGTEPEFGDFFGGFKFFGPIALYQIVYSLIMFVLSVPFIIILFTLFLPPELLTSAAMSEDPQVIMQHFENAEFQENIPAIVGISSIWGIVMLLVGITYILTPPLIVLEKLSFWKAMETSRKTVFSKLPQFIGLYIVLGLINFAGALPFGLGLLYTIPLTFGVIYAIYDSGRRSEETDENNVNV